MLRKLLVFILIYSSAFYSYGSSLESLKADIESLLASKKATVGVSILAPDTNQSVSINGDVRLPLQSVFKYHIAAAVLHQVDLGKLSLQDEITITEKELNNGLWSPIRKKYPKGTKLTLAEIIEYTVAGSDNVGCDMLLVMLGGPKMLEQYLHQIGIKDIAIVYNEVDMQSAWLHQYENWTTASAATQALSLFHENKNQLLSAESHKFLWQVMKSTWTGSKTLRAGLPKGTIVGNKTGHSGKNDEGVTGARNDIGVIFLPDGGHYYVSVLISDSMETNETNNKMTADIAKLTWQHFNQ